MSSSQPASLSFSAARPVAQVDATEGDVNSTMLREGWARGVTGESRGLIGRDERAFLRQALSTPCLEALSGCAGSTLTTLGGRELLDFHGNSVHNVGYGHPRVVEAMKRQLDALPFCPRRYTNHAAVELAERLGALSPGGQLSKVLLAPAGAEAMSMAMKLARVATGRSGFVSFWGAFHGATIDTISIGGERHFREGVGALLPGCEHVPAPTPRSCVYGCAGSCLMRCADGLERALEHHPDVAAVIAEPIRCTTVDLVPDGFWQRVRETCDRRGCLLVFDEIPLCMGRTGRMFACEHDGVTPDILVLGKALGAGVVPLAAMLARPGLDVAGHTSLGHFTHEKSPLLCAAALAALDVLRDEGLIERSRELGERLVSNLRELQRRHKGISDVRGRGLLVGVEIGGDDAAATAERLMYACLERGLSFKVSGGRVLTLTPPLTISVSDLDRAVEILDDAFASLGRFRPGA